MANTGRVSPKLYDSIEYQIEKHLKREKINAIKDKISSLENKVVYIKNSFTDTSILEVTDPSIVNETGYDYSTNPPTSGVTYAASQDRIDNIDDFLLTVIADLAALELAISLSFSVWEIIEYVASDVLSSITLPSTITGLKIWKNGVRLMSGVLYDYTYSGSSIFVSGISGDRFIIEFTTSDTGS